MSGSAVGGSVMERVVRIVEAFGPDSPVLGVSELSRMTGLHVATVSRYADGLVTAGWLERDEQRRLRAGVRLWEVASRASAVSGLRGAAMPFMEDLSAVHRHHVQLGVLKGHDVLFVERLGSAPAVAPVNEVAGRLPLHASSAGLVLLAFAPVSLQDEVLSGPLHAFTGRTITDPAQLRRVLAQVRSTGHATCAGHLVTGACSVAVPVRDRSGAVVAAMSLIMPDDGSAHLCVPGLRAACLGIGRSLGVPDPRRERAASA
ncbi:IclR family transcriptional regulator [Kitasatospora sp. NBC_01539]|uniref:IclR family transcriptional regulator n=1 Tax=Kitasatospora sp. NBC_01539 TaxID=2903577 RepID=UPI003860100A